MRQLSPYYQHWIEEEVPYIISTDERRAFLGLRSDLEREKFIQAFWDARNPTPGADYNTYKEEYYRRLAYASEHFGSARYQDGWRTDQGRMYVVLGAPKSVQTYHLTANIRDLEIWFYQSPSPALPGFFNIVFFRPGAGEDYKIYSPINDGPYRLVTTGQQNNKAAMHIIQQQLGPELAHAALTLIPSEPVDLDSGESPSMTSDLMLQTIRYLADSPIEKARITMARAREKATSSVVVAGTAQQFEPMVIADSRGRLVLSYLLSGQSPDPALVGLRPDGKTGYSLALRTSLFTEAGKLIYEQQNRMEGVVTPGQAKAAQERSFGAEDRLPVLPGEYQLEVSVRNNLTGLATISHEHVVVPKLSPTALMISPLLVYKGPSPVRDASASLPFSMAGLRFAPRAVTSATIHVGDKLPLVFQLHLPPATPDTPRPASVHLHYAVGMLTGNGAAPLEVEEDVSTESADPAGNLLTGHTLDTFDLGVGIYRVAVRLSGATGMAPGSSVLQLKVVPVSTPIELWTAYGPEPPEAVEQDDVKRGLIAAAEGNLDLACTWYKASLLEFADRPRSLALLAAALHQLNRNQELAGLATQPQFARAAEPETVLLVGDALESTGATARAISFVEGQLALQAPDTRLLTALAGYYSHEGKEERAREYRGRAMALSGKHNAG